MNPIEKMKQILASLKTGTPAPVDISALLGRETVRYCPWPIAAPATSCGGMYLSPEIMAQLASAYNPKVELATIRWPIRGNGAHWMTGPGVAYVSRLHCDPVAESTMPDNEIADALLGRCEAVLAGWTEDMDAAAEAALIASTAVAGMPTVLWASIAGVKQPWGGDGFGDLIYQGFQKCSIGAYLRPDDKAEIWRLGHVAMLGSENPAVSSLPAFRADVFRSEGEMQPGGRNRIETADLSRGFSFLEDPQVDKSGAKWIVCTMSYSGYPAADDKKVEQSADPAEGEPAPKTEDVPMALAPEDLKAVSDLMDQKIAQAMKKDTAEESAPIDATAIAASAGAIGEAKGLVAALFSQAKLTQGELDGHMRALSLAQKVGGKQGQELAESISKELGPKAIAPTKAGSESFLMSLLSGGKAEVTNPQVTKGGSDFAAAFATLTSAAEASKDPKAKQAMFALANAMSGIVPGAAAKGAA